MKQTHRGASRVLIISITGLGLLACPGPAGTPCAVADNGDGTSTISCPGGEQVTIKNGTNGKSCTIEADADAGTKTIRCEDGTTVTVTDGTDGTNGTNGTNGKNANDIADWNALSTADMAAADLGITINSVSNEDHPTANFTVRDTQGRLYKGIPAMFFTGIGLLQLVPGNTADGGNGLAIDTWVSHIVNCATCMVGTESGTTAGAKFVDLGNGTYTFTFAKDVRNPTPYDGGVAIAGVPYDPNAHHRFGINLRISATNAVTGANKLPDGGFMTVNATRPVDAVLDYIPATGENVTGQNDKVNTDNCLECHGQLRANANNAGGAMVFHNGQRYITQYCPICHNDQRKYNGTKVTGNPMYREPAIDYATGSMDGGAGTPVYVIHGEVATNLPVWIHKIHMGKKLLLKGTYPGGIFGTELNKIGFPQSPANCTKCHSGAAQADNWKDKPNRRACNACHDRVDFTTGLNHGLLQADGTTQGGIQLDDSKCTTCHGPAGISPVAKKHIPVAPPDPNNKLVGGTNSNTNAAWLGNPLNRPDGARSFTYDLPAGAVTAVTTADGGVNASVKFRMMEEEKTPVVFNDPTQKTELIDDFIGGPSVYCAFSLPQDGIAQPADFNATVSGYVKTIWNGEAAGTAGAGTMTFDSATGYYTVVLTGVNLTAAASHLTCGLGFTYSLTSTVRPALATIPLTQINLPAYPFDTSTKAGGLSIPSPNVWRVATGHIGRRGQTASIPTTGAGLIVDNAKCHNCHKALGVAPSFHAGQRNNGASCAFCHTPNRTSNGWAAGSPYYIHALHGTAMRTVPYNWNALTPTEGFYEIRFPGRVQVCETCHNPGFFDFSNLWYTDLNLATRLPQTAATDTNTGGLLNKNPTLPDGGVNAAWYMVSPYVKGDGLETFGKGYAFAAATGAITEAARTTRVHSPTATVCFSCHDAARSVSHMEANGGQLYVKRSDYKPSAEQCLICHGPGKIAAIKDIHYR